jgi:LPS-assembly protein
MIFLWLLNIMKKFLIFFVLITSHLSVIANGVNLTCALDHNLCDNCNEYQLLFPLEEFSKNIDSLDIEADESEIVEGNYLLSGDVKVNSENLYISANNVEVSSVDNSMLATGEVKFQDQTYLISSDLLSATKDKDNVTAIANNASYQDYAAGQGGANGFTERIEKTTNSVLLTNSTYSLCPVEKNDWLIDADQIELNLEKNRGYADNATIKFYGIPIFYTPKHSWVLSGRGSGFLTPDYSSYNEPGQQDDSYSLRIPYYINLAPDRDLLIALNYMSSRNFIFEGKYRQLIAPKITPGHEDSIFSVEAKYLPEDKITNLKRWLLNFNEELDITSKTHLSAQYYRVSDRKYFKEIARSNTGEKSLKSFLKLSYDDPDGDLLASILTEDEQVVNDGSPTYTRQLEGSVTKSFNSDEKMPIKIGLSSTKFSHDTPSKESGTRTHSDIQISRPLSFKYPQITPRVSASFTNYSLKNSPNINRTILGSGLDIDFTYSNNSSLFGYDVRHEVRPMITYNYRAKKIQGNIPIFDSTDKYDDIISFADLTSGERYTGLDRITNANDITLSIQSNYRDINANEIDPNLLSLKIAQSFYTDDEVVSDTANTNYETRKSYSDIAASIDMAIEDFTYNAEAQFNPDTSKIVNKSNTVTYSPSTRKFISLSFIDEESKNVRKIYGAYPITDAVHIFGGLDKTTSTGVTNGETTGIAYESCCWAIRLAHFKDGSKSAGYNYSTGMELVLTGLGSTSSPLKGKIEGNIPGYSAKLR